MADRHPVSGCDLRVRDAIWCPVCREGLVDVSRGLRCDRCGRTYPVREGVPILRPAEARRAPMDPPDPER